MPEPGRTGTAHLTPVLLNFLVAAASYFVGGFIGPLVYPYKTHMGAGLAEVFQFQLQGLTDSFTYFGPNATFGYLFFATIFAVSYWLFGLRNRYLVAGCFLLIGLYLGIMFEGRLSVRIEDWYDRLPGIPDRVGLWDPGFNLFYFLVMLGVPLALTYAVARTGRPLSSHCPARTA